MSKTTSISEKEHHTEHISGKDVKVVEARGAIAAAHQAGTKLNPWSYDSIVLYFACFVRYVIFTPIL